MDIKNKLEFISILMLVVRIQTNKVIFQRVIGPFLVVFGGFLVDFGLKIRIFGYKIRFFIVKIKIRLVFGYIFRGKLLLFIHKT